MTALLVALGAAAGAPLRYLVDSAVKARTPSAWPWGTWVINVSGSFLLGGVVALTPLLGPGTAALAGTGFCGAFTTYSTFGWETLSLLERGRIGLGAGYAAASAVAGVGAALAGHAVAGALLG
ncbi:fluoride efflux transporter FluC [Pseudonocardia spirodelae]|uniref:Fluoride-specific ion channel FluC n=1 Tax=Pseudonocardia spirodelae TaxID=3133431 RepID=A0ABU8T804_9PSEU